ncbi:MAG: lipase family protein [Acidobacteria bacterium]|nr:lipase family protein [Acidobacteriota bacterium]
MPQNLKPVPTLKLSNLLPPNTIPRDAHKYQYNIPDGQTHRFHYFTMFEGFNHSGHSYQPATNAQPPMSHAWWFAEAALLAYDNFPAVQTAFSNLGTAENPVPRVTDLSAGSTFCVGVEFEEASGKKTAAIVFRGTEILKNERDPVAIIRKLTEIKKDVLTDASFLPFSVGRGVKIHSGFLQALSLVWDKLSRFLISRNLDRLWFTGHSLGGALAMLSAYRFGKEFPNRVPIEVFTFGAPCVGNAAFRNDFKSLTIPAFRFVNHRDIVPPVLELPLLYFFVRYSHVGEVFYFNNDGQLANEPSLLGKFVNSILVGSVESLIDHSPLFYAVNCWNNRPSA